MNLSDFLLARIAEDEAAAREAIDVTDAYGDGFTIEWQWAYLTAHTSGGRGAAWHPGAPSPARVLAECEAKRRIVEEALEVVGPELDGDPFADATPGLDDGQVWAFADAMRALAQPYDSHPDFDPAWRL